MTEQNIQKNPYPLGAHMDGGRVRFAFVSKAADCGILLYDRKTGKMQRKIPFVKEDRIGNIYCKYVEDIDTSSVTYLFYEGDRLVPDERGKVFPEIVPYGEERNAEHFKAGFSDGSFDWGEAVFPRIPYNQAVGYCLHVRGFTKHASSNVKHRGTFAGIMEKIPYLKEIGVTTIELQPAYEFAEIPLKEEHTQKVPFIADPGMPTLPSKEKLNYWGYKKGFYYAPKAAYSFSSDAAREFKELVKALHENQMELLMQFYFPDEVKRSEIPEILRFWVLEYHVDGFHLLGENLMADMLAMDDALADTKLWYYQFDTDRIYGKREQPLYPHVAEYNDSWYYDMRKFLKGDSNMLGSVAYHMRHIPEKAGHIHYLTNYFGFTLADLVSYDYKHNEVNGEENRDGNDYNCSWNCGEEGNSRRQSVRRLRMKQMKNALCLVLLSQSTPLIFMGDEFGNSQKGNNNPYCQDNAVTWLDWKGVQKNAELLEFWKMLVGFRKKYPILRPAHELRLMDYIACGYPDLSYHGRYAWRPEMEGHFKHIGILLCGKYAKTGRESDDTFLYLAMNMNWNRQELALPKLPKGMCWAPVFSTDPEFDVRKVPSEKDNTGLLREIPSRSIVMFISVPVV